MASQPSDASQTSNPYCWRPICVISRILRLSSTTSTPALLLDWRTGSLVVRLVWSWRSILSRISDCINASFSVSRHSHRIKNWIRNPFKTPDPFPAKVSGISRLRQRIFRLPGIWFSETPGKPNRLAGVLHDLPVDLPACFFNQLLIRWF